MTFANYWGNSNNFSKTTNNNSTNSFQKNSVETNFFKTTNTTTAPMTKQDNGLFGSLNFDIDKILNPNDEKTAEMQEKADAKHPELKPKKGKEGEFINSIEESGDFKIVDKGEGLKVYYPIDTNNSSVKKIVKNKDGSFSIENKYDDKVTEYNADGSKKANKTKGDTIKDNKTDTLDNGLSDLDFAKNSGAMDRKYDKETGEIIYTPKEGYNLTFKEVRENKDGSFSVTYAHGGNTIEYNADGTPKKDNNEKTKKANEFTSNIIKDYNHVYETGDGNVFKPKDPFSSIDAVVIHDDGSYRIVDKSGTVTEFNADGTVKERTEK